MDGKLWDGRWAVLQHVTQVARISKLGGRQVGGARDIIFNS